MVPFGGWDMPVEYAGIASEHLAVRTGAGLFDVSHMGQIELAGKDALAAVQRISTNDAAKLAVGQAQYSGLTTPEGTFVDDILVYRLAGDHYLLVVNAGTIESDYKWIAAHTREAGDVAVVNSSARYALLAVQGPSARGIVQELTSVDLSSLKYYWFTHGEVAGVRSIISRTGYTGEDGFELFMPPHSAERVWNTILETGASAGIVPVGLGARDTLRLEAGMNLYGADMDETTTPLESGLAWTVALEPSDRKFIGREVLDKQKAQGVPRQLVGLVLEGKGVLRNHQKVACNGAGEGEITSGSFSPTLNQAIALARVPAAVKIGDRATVDLRGKPATVRVVKYPFVRNGKSCL